MSTVLPREEAVETIFSKILASPEASGRLSGVFYDHIDDDHRLTDNDRDHFLQVLFHAYQNGDISALLLELCGRSMFDLLREAYLIPKKFHGKAGENPVLLTDAAGELLPGEKVSAREYAKFKETYEHHECAPRSALYLADGYDLVRTYTEGLNITEEKDNRKRGVLALYALPDTCKLHIVKMENWRHGDPYWLPVKPSPNLPNDQSIRLYPSLCFFEGTNISVGRGTYYPFQILGAPDARYGDFTFTPTSLPGFDTKPLHKDKECYGTDLREYPFTGGLTLKFLLDFYNKAGNDQAFFFTRPQWFDLLAGTKELRFQIVRGLKEDEIRASWQPALNKYKKIRKKYLLYPDYR